VRIVVSHQVLGELDIALRRKAPHLLPTMALLLDRLQVEVAPPASAERVRICLEFTGHPGDAQVLAAAWQASVSYLVSLNQQHILNNVQARAALPFRLGTPGDFIQAYRESFLWK
jgi:predicted nucleic acid-binding protein